MERYIKLQFNEKGRPIHEARFKLRRFLNWFPLGLTYSFLYMARYNLTVSKNALGDLMTKEDFGIIFGAGTITYAFSFLINGPLTDRFGGKRAILLASGGSAFMNLIMGVVTLLILHGGFPFGLRLTFSILYAINMYFQSMGAVAIVKVNASWFHVRERGIFGGIFGILISLGLYFAFDWGQAIVNFAEKWNPTNPPLYLIFFIPASILITFFIIETFLLKDSPGEAGFYDFDTGDASSGEEDRPFSLKDVIVKILTNPILLTIAFIEFCTGVLRNGIMHWFPIYAKEEMANPLLRGDWEFFLNHWGLLLMIAGVFGGLFAGWISDLVFGSRRAPVAGLMYIGLFVSIILIFFAIDDRPYFLGTIMFFMSLFVIGTHGILSGTSTMDFGGRRAAGTAVGLIDGFVYLGTGFQSLCLGFLTTRDWHYWPWFLLPFSLLGIYLSSRIWHELPGKKRAH